MEKIKLSKKITERYKRSNNRSDWMITRWMLILRLAIVTSTLGVAILVIPSEMIDKFPITIIVLGTYLLTLLYWLAHRVSTIHRPLLAIQIAFDIFIITVIIYYTGSHESFFVGFYLLSIMCASLFFRRLVTFIFATQAAVFYVLFILLYMNYSGFIFESDMKSYIELQSIFYVVIMYVVGVISSYYAEKISKKDTALISALKLLKEARLDTSDILQSMTNGLITVNMDSYIVYINRAAEKILKIENRYAVGKKYFEVLDENSAELIQVIERTLKNASGLEREIQVSNKNGNTIPLGLTAVPLYDTDKSRRGTIINFKDLTEKNKLIEMIRQSDRMAAIGELSAAIAHEIRNPLASICNAAELLKESYLGDDRNNIKLIDVIDLESERLQRISTEFLDFAKEKNPEICELNLHKTVENILTLIENDPRNTDEIVIRNNIEDDKIVYFDEDQLKQLILNIFINSLDALEGKGEIVIDTENSKKYIRLNIYDNGKGFPEDVLEHVFEPFFSTKKDGSGLGLALVRKLVITNHGRVLARNKAGAGAEISLDIPVNGV